MPNLSVNLGEAAVDEGKPHDVAYRLIGPGTMSSVDNDAMVLIESLIKSKNTILHVSGEEIDRIALRGPSVRLFYKVIVWQKPPENVAVQDYSATITESPSLR